jgi:hypothetical protein
MLERLSGSSLTQKAIEYPGEAWQGQMLQLVSPIVGQNKLECWPATPAQW